MWRGAFGHILASIFYTQDADNIQHVALTVFCAQWQPLQDHMFGDDTLLSPPSAYQPT
jgi:hypothetical protein